MRRYAVVLVAGLLLCMVYRTQPAFAGVYDPGWNLVAGPDGSRLVGAEGILYTWQPGDVAYEALPLDTPLRGCVGYWAYFPDGGSVLPGSNSGATCSITVPAAGWVLVGNPSNHDSVAVPGAAAIYTYTPHGGYESGAQVFAGQGAWVLGGTASDQAGPLPSFPAAPASGSLTGPAPFPHAGSTAGTSYLLDASGSGDADLPAFTTRSGAPTICYALSGQSPSGLYGPGFAFAVRELDTALPVATSAGDGGAGTLASTSGCQVVSILDGPGSYTLSVTATDWTEWSLRVYESAGTAIAAVRPSQATALCRDGTLDLGPPSWTFTCAQHGGVVVWYHWPGEPSPSGIGMVADGSGSP